MNLTDWLKGTTAEHLLHRDLVTLYPQMLMSEAAAILLHQQISGAPVVDDRGVCVGVLSASDFVKAWMPPLVIA